MVKSENYRQKGISQSQIYYGRILYCKAHEYHRFSCILNYFDYKNSTFYKLSTVLHKWVELHEITHNCEIKRGTN